MPGYLTEKLGLTETALRLDPSHFRILRLAILRGLTCEQLSANIFKVSSSRPDHPPYKVDAVSLLCPCDSTTYCSHLALAVDRWHEREADLMTRGDYFEARRLDFGGLHRLDDLHCDDRRFVKRCAESVARRFTAERAPEDYAPRF